MTKVGSVYEHFTTIKTNKINGSKWTRKDIYNQQFIFNNCCEGVEQPGKGGERERQGAAADGGPPWEVSGVGIGMLSVGDRRGEHPWAWGGFPD